MLHRLSDFMFRLKASGFRCLGPRFRVGAVGGKFIPPLMWRVHGVNLKCYRAH